MFGGCLDSEDSKGSVASSCCDHCLPPVEGNDAPSPDIPLDCNCGDCLCRGALLINEAPDDLIVVELVSFLTRWVELESTQVELPMSQVQRRSNVLPIEASALEVRAALCCWLI